MSLELYTWATPNGQKVHIMLEELGVPYELRPVNIFEGEQFTDAFFRINPNRRIPALIDATDPARPPLRVFESAAILLHLAEKYGRLLPQDPYRRSEALQWLMWQAAGLGPMVGQGQHFWSYAREKIPYAIERYTNEGMRLLWVMDKHLADREYLAEEYSIADISCFPWVRIHKLANLSLADFPNVKRWYGAIRNRPAVERGLAILREHLTGVPSTERAHDIMFGKTQFAESKRGASAAPAAAAVETATVVPASNAAAAEAATPATSLNINGVAHTILTVSRFHEAKRFYAPIMEFLGLKKVFEGKDFVYWVGGRTAVGLQECAEEYRSERFVQYRVGLHHLAFRARERADIDRAAQFLKEMNAHIVRGPMEAGWAPGYYYVLFEDPDGIRLEICHVPGQGVLGQNVEFRPGNDFKT